MERPVRIATLPTSRLYIVPSERVGRSILAQYTHELEGCYLRKWNAERPIVFILMMFIFYSGVLQCVCFQVETKTGRRSTQQYSIVCMDTQVVLQFPFATVQNLILCCVVSNGISNGISNRTCVHKDFVEENR